MQLGEPTFFAPGDLHNAGHYLAVLVGGSSTENGAFDVTAAHQPMELELSRQTFIAFRLTCMMASAALCTYLMPFRTWSWCPHRYRFNSQAVPVRAQMRTALTRNGVAWTKMNSAAKEGAAQFEARVGDATSTRVIQQVPGDPCHLRMSARPSGQRLALETEPVRDCSGNARAGRNDCHFHGNL